MIDQYIRKAKVVRVIDGDTIEAEIDLGFMLKLTKDIRFAGINAPEIHGVSKDAGLAAKAFIETKLTPGKDITVMTVKWSEKYGRYLAVVYVDGENLNQTMLDTAHAVQMKE